MNRLVRYNSIEHTPSLLSSCIPLQQQHRHTRHASSPTRSSTATYHTTTLSHRYTTAASSPLSLPSLTSSTHHGYHRNRYMIYHNVTRGVARKAPPPPSYHEQGKGHTTPVAPTTASATPAAATESEYMDDPTSPGKKAWVNPALQPLPVEEPRQVISINIITMDGQRAKIEGVVGDRLLDAIKNSEAADLVPARCDGGGNSPIVFGEGPACRSCHVYIDPESLAKLPPKSANEVKLSYWIETKTEHTRFSCEIELTKDLDNMTVVIPEYTRADVA